MSDISEEDSAHGLDYGPQHLELPRAQPGIGNIVELSSFSDSDDELDHMCLNWDPSDSEIDLESLERLRSGRLRRATDAYVYWGNLLA
jgi:hypothetical protein